MESNIKIYFDDRIVILTDENIRGRDNVHVYENQKMLARHLLCFAASDDAFLYIVHSDRDELLKHVAKCFKYVEAAGGLVALPDGRILLIKRLGKWDLPKGKAEKGESLQETAIREVTEECGLSVSPKITSVLAHTYHTYHRAGALVLKHTAWFTMRYDGEDVSLHPQLDEDITEAVWLPVNQLDCVLQNTYKSIKQVLKRVEKS